MVEDNLVNCLAGPGGFFSDGYLTKNKERNIYVFTGTANAGSDPGNKMEEPQTELLTEAVNKIYPGSVTTIRKGFDSSMFKPVSLLVTEGEEEGKEDAVDLKDLLDDFD